jgi:hypothetical protein
MHHHHPHRTPTPANPAALTIPATPIPTLTPSAPFSLLVLPNCFRCAPLIPLLVANTVGLIVAVFAFLVYAVVANVCVVLGLDSARAPGVRNTRAMQGAGSGIVQVEEVLSQGIVWMETEPVRRPSEAKVLSPNVCAWGVSEDSEMQAAQGQGTYLSCPCDVVFFRNRRCLQVPMTWIMVNSCQPPGRKEGFPSRPDSLDLHTPHTRPLHPNHETSPTSPTWITHKIKCHQSRHLTILVNTIYWCICRC